MDMKQPRDVSAVIKGFNGPEKKWSIYRSTVVRSTIRIGEKIQGRTAEGKRKRKRKEEKKKGEESSERCRYIGSNVLI